MFDGTLDLMAESSHSNEAHQIVADKLDDDTPVIRYLPKDRFLEMIEKKVFVLTHISRWDDPYEAFLLRGDVIQEEESEPGTAEMSVFDEYKLIYGQSWSIYTDESELRWRAYCKAGEGVRIQTTIGKLKRLLAKMNRSEGSRGEGKGGTVIIREVEYKPQEEFDQLMTPENLLRYDNASLEEKLEMFFLKREEFKEEKEVRVVVSVNEDALDKGRDADGSLLDGSLLKIRLNDISDLIEEVLVDPRMPRNVYEQIVCRLRHQNSGMKIRRNKLFDWPTISEIRYIAMAYKEFWTRLKGKLNGADGIVRALNMKNRAVSDRNYWELQHCGNGIPNLKFNSKGASINFYSHSQRLTDAISARIAEIEAIMLCHLDCEETKKGYRFSIWNRDVSVNDGNSWQRAIDWFCEKISPFFALCMDEAKRESLRAGSER